MPRRRRVHGRRKGPSLNSASRPPRGRPRRRCRRRRDPGARRARSGPAGRSASSIQAWNAVPNRAAGAGGRGIGRASSRANASGSSRNRASAVTDRLLGSGRSTVAAPLGAGLGEQLGQVVVPPATRAASTMSRPSSGAVGSTDPHELGRRQATPGYFLPRCRAPATLGRCRRRRWRSDFGWRLVEPAVDGLAPLLELPRAPPAGFPTVRTASTAGPRRRTSRSGGGRPGCRRRSRAAAPPPRRGPWSPPGRRRAPPCRGPRAAAGRPGRRAGRREARPGTRSRASATGCWGTASPPPRRRRPTTTPVPSRGGPSAA